MACGSDTTAGKSNPTGGGTGGATSGGSSGASAGLGGTALGGTGTGTGGSAGTGVTGGDGGLAGTTVGGSAGDSATGGSVSAGSGGDGGGTAGAAGAAGTGGPGGAGGYVPPPSTRTETLLGTGWRFQRMDVTGAQAPAFDDSSWTQVSVPHTWNATDGQDGGGNYYRGTGWYRRHVMVPADAAGKRLYLEFDGSNIVTDVYVNGTSVGQHRGGFARFRFDVTSALMPGADNVVAVKVSNAAVNDVPPLDADFTFFGGLYRDVRLIATNALHVDTMDFASSGVYLDTTSVSAASASLRARVRVTNNDSASQSVTVRTVVVRADGSVETELSATGSVAAGMTSVLSATATIANPHLWNGVADPYVYQAYAEVRVGTSVVDWVNVPLGFRFYSVDPAQGFFLNGRYLDLHGVNRHQDRLGMGWAITNREHDEDMALIRELGATVVRLSHYEHAQYFHDLADRAGIALWAEIPLVNSITDSTAFRNNAVQQMTELIRQNYNHPAILFWGIGNEQRTDNTATNNLLTTLATLVETEDPTRLSTYAQCCTSDTGGLPAHSDVVGYNTYYGWYDAFGAAADFGAWADNLHAQRPTWKIGISEYGAGAGITQHADNPPQPDPYGTPHPEEWQNLVHESHWKQMKTRPYLWAKIIWNMFDFAVDSRDEGDTPGRNDKGLVTYDRRTRKDAFFWYKANWSTTPVVYITSRRFTPRTTATTTVKVYSNLDSVTLTVNGTSRGAGTGADHIFQWTNVPLTTGQNTVQATGTSGTTTAMDSVTWTRN
ncbi:MAG TPA: glycoside hydrolase family 2 TIM barrel-domain containing protein [Polyangiaceae bacterium]